MVYGIGKTDFGTVSFSPQQTLEERTSSFVVAWRLHKMSRNYATIQHRAGTDAATLQQRLGHSKVETTLRYLSAESVRSQAEAARVARAFGETDIDFNRSCKSAKRDLLRELPPLEQFRHSKLTA